MFSWDKDAVIKSTLKNIADKFNGDWEFRSAELKDDKVILQNHKGLKFAINMEYLGFEKVEE